MHLKFTGVLKYSVFPTVGVLSFSRFFYSLSTAVAHVSIIRLNRSFLLFLYGNGIPQKALEDMLLTHCLFPACLCHSVEKDRRQNLLCCMCPLKYMSVNYVVLFCFSVEFSTLNIRTEQYVAYRCEIVLLLCTWCCRDVFHYLPFLTSKQTFVAVILK